MRKLSYVRVKCRKSRSTFNLFQFSLFCLYLKQFVNEFRNIHRRCSIRKGVLSNSAKFIGKHVQAPASVTCIFTLENVKLQNFKEIFAVILWKFNHSRNSQASQGCVCHVCICLMKFIKLKYLHQEKEQLDLHKTYRVFSLFKLFPIL